MRIYIVRDGDAFKLGIAHCVHRRIKGMQVDNPRPINHFITVPGNKAQEQAIHKRLKKWNITGEWFEIEALPMAVSLLPVPRDLARLRP